MKKVIKVSINKMAFTLSEEAYHILKVYLDHLRRYYSHDENGNEIVDGIEERIAELLGERTHAGLDVVSKEMVNEILDIMGPLEVIEEESGTSNQSDFSGHDFPPPPKKLYRDIEHKVIGGVCAGLSAYFHIDIAVVRIIAVVLLLLPNMLSFARSLVNWETYSISFGGFFFVVYIIMWILVPAAVTVEEKYAMRGEPLSAKGVQRTGKLRAASRSSAHRRQPVGSYRTPDETRIRQGNNALRILLRVVAVVIGLFFIIASSAVLISLVLGFAATGFALRFSPTALLDLIAFSGNVFWVKTFGLLTLVLPVLGFLYIGSVLVFNIRRHKWIGAALFFTWLVSLIGLIITGAEKAASFRRHETVEQHVPITLTSDTLFIDLEAADDFLFERYWLEADQSVYRLGWFEGKTANPGIVVFPSLALVRQSGTDTPSVWVKSHTLHAAEKDARYITEKTENIFQIDGNVLTISAMEITKETPWKGSTHSLKIFVPADHIVIVRKPIYHEFGKSRSRKMSVKGVF